MDSLVKVYNTFTRFVKHAWSLVKPDSIANCFQHCHFSSKIAENDSNISIDEKNMDEIIKKEDFDLFCECDKEEPTTTMLTDCDICEEIMKGMQEEDDSIETENLTGNVEEHISDKGALVSVMFVRQYLQQNNFRVEMELTYKIEDAILNKLHYSKQL